jgi:hypothetical protein
MDCGLSDSSDRPAARIPGLVLSPDVFADRLASLTGSVAAVDGAAVVHAAAASLPAAIRGAEQHARRLHHLWWDVAPPTLELHPGPRGRMVNLVQRTARRLTWWYIEPRWTGQREFDAVAARFASETTRAVEVLRSEVQELRNTNDRLARQLYQLQLQVAEIRDSQPHQSAVNVGNGAEE